MVTRIRNTFSGNQKSQSNVTKTSPFKCFVAYSPRVHFHTCMLRPDRLSADFLPKIVDIYNENQESFQIVGQRNFLL